MENVNPPSPTLEFYQKKYNYTSLDIPRWSNEMRRTGSYIDFIEYLERRGQVHKTFKEFTLGAPSTPQNASLSETYAPYEPSPRIVSYEPPSCMSWLGTTIIQDEHIGDLDVMEDVDEHDHVDKKDLGFMIDDDESQETHDESFGQFEYSSQNIEDDPYDSDIEVEMPRKALEILGKMLGLDYNKTHVEDIGDLDTRNDEVNNISSQSTPQVLPSFEAHTPPVTYPEEVEETLGISMEVEPLDQAPLGVLLLLLVQEDKSPTGCLPKQDTKTRCDLF
jgi:hypothetical protein